MVEINDPGLSKEDRSKRVQQLFPALETNIDTGIRGDEKDLDSRIKAFGSNRDSDLEGHQANNPAVNKSLNQLVLEAFKDSTIILLLCCATLSLIIDIKMNGLENGFIDGSIIFLAIFIVINFGNIFRFLKSRIINIWLIKRLMMQKQKRLAFVCVVIRQGKLQNIPVSQVVVGDIVSLQTDSQVPADGLFINGSKSFKLDDGNLVERVASKYFVVFTGAKVVEGNCRMLVTSVGENTERSKLMKSLANERKHKESSKLQNGVDKMNSRLEKLWLLLSLIVLIVQLLRCFLSKSDNDEKSNNPDPKGVKNRVEEIMNEATKLMNKRQGGKMNGLAGILCVLLFATRDGLPLGIFVLFYFASKKMSSLDTIVANLSACAKLGLVTTVFLSKTDDLALNRAEMAELWIGLNCIKDVSKELNGQVLEILQQGVLSMMNSSGDQTIEDYSLLYWAQHLFLHVQVNDTPVEVNRSDGNSVALRRIEESQEIVETHWKGDPERILSQCTHFYEADGTMQPLDEEKKATFSRIIEEQLASDHNLPCFAFGYKKEIVCQEEKGDDHDDDNNEKTLIDDPAGNGMILIGFVRLKNPYPPEIRQAVEAFWEMGVNIKLMVDVDNVNAARIMALHSGLLRSDHDQEDMQVTVIEGKDFRNNCEEARMKMMDKIHVIANASPADKLLIVQCLREKTDEVVAATCSCIRDCPSLVGADVGIFMGKNTNSSARIFAKRDADVIVNEGLTIVKVANTLRTGRYVCQSIKKFLELHLTLNISAFILNLIFQFSKNELQLSSVQLLWTNLIVEALGAFALAILVVVEVEPILNPQNGPQTPGESSWRAPPPPLYGAGPIITKTMGRNIIVQSLFQVAILMVLGLKGKIIFHVDDVVLKTMIFNSYVLCQVFVMIGAIKIKKINTSNILLGRFSIDDFLFLVVVGMIVALQTLLIEIMGVVAHWGQLDCKMWWICIPIAALSSPLGYAAKRVLVILDFALPPCK
ncbi:hypothetical protein ACH5RR_027790 [Cinchona calisaya]|uniref:Cation-transporting P-type ATPase C-terminal domain-containing protein n=1 Tax=Cinchona calisaya TaxID=153742 RepID=A0ABD2YQT9_9GENT